MSLHVRRGTNADGPAVLQVYNRFVGESFAAYPDQPMPPQVFEHWVDQARDGVAFVVEGESEGIVGFGVLKKTMPFSTFARTAEVGYFILPEYTGQGLGSKMLELLETEAKKLGVKVLLANIASLNPRSVEFHARNGFSICGRWANAIEKFGRVFDIIWMEKQL